MIKLPTQFDARARQQLETAAAGGSTSTCCSSCVVTLGSTVVASSMYLAHLRKRARALDGDAVPSEPAEAVSGPAADSTAWQPDGAAQSSSAAAETEEKVNGENVSEAPTPAMGGDKGKGLLASPWFWVTMVILVAVLSPVFGDLGALLVTVEILMALLVGWVKLHQRAGVGPVQAVVVGLVGLVLILGAIVLEAVAWMGAL